MMKHGLKSRAPNGGASCLAIMTVLALGGAALSTSAWAQTDVAAPAATSTAPPAAAPAPDLGDNVLTRFFNYQKLEWGQSGPPADPSAPPSRRDGIPPQPENSPPFPFTEWPYGGTTNMMTNRTASVDSPFMVAIANTGLGKAMNKAGIQAYGWIDVGANLSTSTVKGGNSPAAYSYNPNTVQLDQAVIYLERTPDTVQKDHIDWGFRLSAIYGENYRYTTSYGLASYQLLKRNNNYGYDFPMLYGELFVPQILDGLLVRVGRFISLPDIEAQLAPNNYMYSHSMTYTFDNYTNTGIQGTLAVNKNLMVQFGVSGGSDTTLANYGKSIPNPHPNPLYPGKTFLADPGAKASYTGCLRLQSNSAKDNIYLCADALNDGVWGYNNLQWRGLTYYHKFNDKWHISIEAYNLYQNNVPNLNNPTVQALNAAYGSDGGTPFNFAFNQPGEAFCKNAQVLTCKATSQTLLAYLNYQFRPLDNLSMRAEVFNDMQGQRTGTQTRYLEFGVGVQHWLSPQIEFRPELSYYKSLDALAFNGNANLGIPANKDYEYILAADIIAHF